MRKVQSKWARMEVLFQVNHDMNLWVFLWDARAGRLDVDEVAVLVQFVDWAVFGAEVCPHGFVEVLVVEVCFGDAKDDSLCLCHCGMMRG